MTNILICEKNGNIIQLLSDTLDNYIINTTDIPCEAVKRVLKGGYDCLIMDMDMEVKGTSCLEVVQILKNANSKIPIIAVTNNDSLEMERKIRKEGIFYYIVGPVEKEEMLQAIKHAVNTKV